MKLLIGCPVYDRAWILEDWFAAIEKQTFPLNEIGFLFELGPDDDDTHDILWNWHMNHPEVSVFDGVIHAKVKHQAHPEGQRVWRHTDYERMVQLRNHLLDRVTSYDPEAFFSLDSDILLENPHTLEQLYMYVIHGGLDAVAPLCYMSPKNADHPNSMRWTYNQVGRRAYRDYAVHNTEADIVRSDIIMAAKMMSKPVYQNVRYRWHMQGEDVGWSAECNRHGYSTYVIPKLYAVHILHRYQLKEYKNHGDTRSVS